MSDPFFVPHITFDGIVTMLSVVMAAAAYLYKESRRRDQTADKIDLLASKVEEHGTKIDKLVSIAEIQARHDERIIGLERWRNLSDQRWEDLRRGDGYVLPLPGTFAKGKA